MLEIKLRQFGNCIILDLCGRIDVDSANLVEVVGQCVRDGYVDILCNLEDIQIVDYMGSRWWLLLIKKWLTIRAGWFKHLVHLRICLQFPVWTE